jgi:hypothetical protein
LYLNKILKQGLKDTEYLNKFIQPLRDGFNQGQIKNANDDIKTKGNIENANINDLNDKSIKDNSIKKNETEHTRYMNQNPSTGPS